MLLRIPPLLLTLHTISAAIPKDRIANCDINPTLPFCGQDREDQKTTRTKDTVKRSDDESSDNAACKTLRAEYRENCKGSHNKDDEFCAAFENVCLRGQLDLNDDVSSKKSRRTKSRTSEAKSARTRATKQAKGPRTTTKAPTETVDGDVESDGGEIEEFPGVGAAVSAAKSKLTTEGSRRNGKDRNGPQDASSKSSSASSTAKPDQSATSAESRATKPAASFSQFCGEYRQRFLYICPDPFRFGERAFIFCPVYAERCGVALPARPQTPTDPPPTTSEDLASSPLARQVCAQYRGFATSYCGNPLMAQPAGPIRDGCDKFQRFCVPRTPPPQPNPQPSPFGGFTFNTQFTQRQLG